jgi:hypothetical protein
MSLDNPDDIFLGPDDEAAPNRVRKKLRRRAGRLQPLPGAYVRVPMQWILKPHRESPFATRAEAELFLLVLYRSYWGQRSVKLTDAVAAEVRVFGTTRKDVLRRLEHKGWIRVERSPRHEAPTVWPIVIAG